MKVAIGLILLGLWVIALVLLSMRSGPLPTPGVSPQVKASIEAAQYNNLMGR